MITLSEYPNLLRTLLSNKTNSCHSLVLLRCESRQICANIAGKYQLFTNLLEVFEAGTTNYCLGTQGRLSFNTHSLALFIAN